MYGALSIRLTSNPLIQGLLGPKAEQGSMAKNGDLTISTLVLLSKLCCKKDLAEKRVPDRDLKGCYKEVLRQPLGSVRAILVLCSVSVVLHYRTSPRPNRRSKTESSYFLSHGPMASFGPSLLGKPCEGAPSPTLRARPVIPTAEATASAPPWLCSRLSESESLGRGPGNLHV